MLANHFSCRGFRKILHPSVSFSGNVWVLSVGGMVTSLDSTVIVQRHDAYADCRIVIRRILNGILNFYNLEMVLLMCDAT